MVLMLKETEQLKIALRHYANALGKPAGDIKAASDAIGLKYVDQKISKLLARLEHAKEQYKNLDKMVDELGVFRVKSEVTNIELEYKSELQAVISDFSDKSAKLKLLKHKFDNLILTLMSAMKISSLGFVEGSMLAKAKIVAELGESQPTFAQIQSVLRSTNLSNTEIVNVSQEYVKQAAIRKAEVIEEVGFDRVFSEIVEDLKEVLYENAKEQCQNLFTNNEDSQRFLGPTLRTTTVKFVERNHSKLYSYAKELIMEIV